MTWPKATWPEGSRAGMESARAELSHHVGMPEVTLWSFGFVTLGLSVHWNYPGALKATSGWQDGSVGKVSGSQAGSGGKGTYCQA